MVSYCRAWILNHVKRAKPLQLCANACKNLTDNCERAFVDLKQALTSVPSLGLPYYNLPFHLISCEKLRYMSAVLGQLQGGQCGPAAYISKQLDPLAWGGNESSPNSFSHSISLLWHSLIPSTYCTRSTGNTCTAATSKNLTPHACSPFVMPTCTFDPLAYKRCTLYSTQSHQSIAYGRRWQFAWLLWSCFHVY